LTEVLIGTLVNISAVESIALISSVTSTIVVTESVGALGIIRALVNFEITLINIRALTGEASSVETFVA
jgi:hypothetical protein